MDLVGGWSVINMFPLFLVSLQNSLFSAGYGDDAKHKVAGASGEERGGGGN